MLLQYRPIRVVGCSRVRLRLFALGPLTDSTAVDVIRKGLEKGEDTTVCLLNYRADGTTFWNHFFVAALRDADDAVVSYLGVQCEVSAEYARAYTHFG